MRLPDATPKPCNDCPWRREAASGWLGPMTADEWLALAHSDEPIACHKTIKNAVDGEGDWSDPAIRQCRGAAMYRKHLAKLPRDPAVVVGPADRQAVFSSPREFSAHHASLAKST